MNGRDMLRAIPAVAAALLLAASPVAADAAAMQPGETFRDCDGCPLMVVVPAGTFEMGTDGGLKGRYEGPVHAVTIRRAFAAGVYEVTNAEYGAFIDATGHESGQKCRVWDGETWLQTPGKSWLDPGYGRPPRPDEPAACISWNDAKAYVQWLAAKTGEPYRLLSEAEWEYLGRGGLPKTRYSWGDRAEDACKTANVFDRSGKQSDIPRFHDSVDCDDGFIEVAPVGQLEPNAYGVYDITGNVWEWVEDCYVMTYFDSQTTEEAQVKHGCDRRGVRGGSWSSALFWQRPEFRGRDPDDLVTHIFGFRVARDLPADDN